MSPTLQTSEERTAVLRPLDQAVVVVTGASSGIGRETAKRMAAEGAWLVLAARSAEALEEAAEECRLMSGRAIAVPADVSDVRAVESLVQRTLDEFGRIDVWVNNAAVFMMGRFEETPFDAQRRLIETNLVGTMIASHAVLPVFKRQRRGTLINVSSLDAETSQPYAAAYVAAKFGVRGFSKALRQELRGTQIHVCTVLPASIDTPLFQHMANYTGRRIKPMPPVYDPALVASAIVNLALKPRREVFVGGVGRVMSTLQKVMPGTVERMMAWNAEKTFFKKEPAADDEGNLYRSADSAEERGGWRKPASRSRWAWAGLAAGALYAGWRLALKKR